MGGIVWRWIGGKCPIVVLADHDHDDADGDDADDAVDVVDVVVDVADNAGDNGCWPLIYICVQFRLIPMCYAKLICHFR